MKTRWAVFSAQAVDPRLIPILRSPLFNLKIGSSILYRQLALSDQQQAMPKVQRSKPFPVTGSRKSSWTPEDNTLLLSERDKKLGWDAIAALFPGRTAAGCKLHWHKLQARSGPWTQEEVELVMKAAHEAEDKYRDYWKAVAVKLGNGRTWKMCQKKCFPQRRPLAAIPIYNKEQGRSGEQDSTADRVKHSVAQLVHQYARNERSHTSGDIADKVVASFTRARNK
ncbi:hypothetical protein BC937DRAFT_86957 [Endogone sp. FLAS-F59071]|nr:hypothetical protein BC937DRAFT_86957 [Endogone sp. FLAS-F59071]|eukprot:RUS19763.1 hypothetical protein BC937DRAFT_86957 [Endogone sp. FLAS-F59071]